MDQIALYQYKVLAKALKLETLGMKKRGTPASVMVRQLMKSKTKEKKALLLEFEAWIAKQ